MTDDGGSGSGTVPEPGATDEDARIACATCGRSLDPSEWHPVAADREGDDIAIRPFCSPECRTEWLDGE